MDFVICRGKMKVVIFGRGYIYRKYKDIIFDLFEVIAFIDNQCKEDGLEEKGIPIYNPKFICNLQYDYILLMSVSAVEMREQLMESNVLIEKIVYYKELDSYLPSHKRNVLADIDIGSNSVLLLSTPVGYHGGAIALLNMAKVYLSLGYEVVIHAKTIDERFQSEYALNNLYFVEEFQSETYRESDYEVYKKFKYVVVNTAPIIMFAIKLSRYRDVVCWLHESKDVYLELDHYWKKDIISETKNSALKIFAVSEMAKKNFEDYVGEIRSDIKILTYGLEKIVFEKVQNATVTFAIIGSIYPLKQQVEFLLAYSMLSELQKTKSRVFIIGKTIDDVYYNKLKEISMNLPSVFLIPELTREELIDFYKEISIVVIPSKQESLPIVAVEAMMNYRYVILTQNSGLTPYVDGIEGVRIIDPLNMEDIKEAIEECIEKEKELIEIANNNYKVYKDIFSNEKFKENMLLYNLC